MSENNNEVQQLQSEITELKERLAFKDLTNQFSGHAVDARAAAVLAIRDGAVLSESGDSYEVNLETFFNNHAYLKAKPQSQAQAHPAQTSIDRSLNEQMRDPDFARIWRSLS